VPSSIPDFHPQPFCQPRDHRLLSVQQALLDIYGESGLPLGEMEQRCLQKVNEYLKSKGLATTSLSTLRRAKQALRKKRLRGANLT
jgi:hypothetical protein